MNRRLRLAALPLLLLAAGAPPLAAQDAPKEAPPAPPGLTAAAPRSTLPPEPKEAGKKEIQRILREWFKNEPRVPVKGKDEAAVKGERAKLVGELETEILKWPGCLRLVSWWKTRLEETQPSENKPTGIKAKEEFVYNGKTYTFAISVPSSYRGKGTESLPVILTVIDKDADPKKLFPATYGRLLDTHLVVASYENNVPNAGVMLNGIYYAFMNYRCDRDRFTLDGIGKGARFVEELAAAEYSALQWNGAVIRSPSAVQALEGNLGLFPVAVAEPSPPIPDPVKAAMEAHAKAGGPGVLVPGGDAAKIQDFIASLPPRKAGDQAKPYQVWYKSLGRMPKWGLWFLVNQAVDGAADQPVRVAISRDPAFNVVDIDATNLAEGTLLLNDEVLDLEQPVVVRVNGIVVAREKPARRIKHTFDWQEGLATMLLGPRTYFVTAVLPFVVPEGDARIPKADRDAAAAAEKRAEEDRRKKEEADRLAAEAAKREEEAKKKAEEDAKNPPAPPADAGPRTFATLDEAKAAARGRPILVVFAAAAEDPRQAALAAALSSEDGKKALAAVDTVAVPPAEAGDAGKAVRDLLAALSGSPDAAAPFLAVHGAAATLPLAGLKPEEIQAAVLKFLAGLAAPAPAPAPAPVEATPIEWGGDWDAAVVKAKGSGTAIAVLFTGAADAKGRKELEAALKGDGECTRSLAKMICVRLDTTGEAGAKNLELQKKLDGSRTPPILWLGRFAGEVQTTLGVVDPANLLAEEATFLAKVRAQLAEAATPPAAAKPEESKPAEPKPAEPKPAEPK